MTELFFLYNVFSVLVTVEVISEVMLNKGNSSDAVLSGDHERSVPMLATSDKQSWLTELASGDGTVGELTRSDTLLSRGNGSVPMLATSDKQSWLRELASGDGTVGELTRSDTLMSRGNGSHSAVVKDHKSDAAHDRILPNTQTNNMNGVDFIKVENVDRVSKKTCAAEHIDISAVPYIVVVYITSPSRKRPKVCTGFFIHINWILTAAHCFDDVRIRRTVIKLGANDYNLRTEYEVRPVQVIKHNHYIRTKNILFNDIALIKVSVPEEFSKQIAIVKVDENEWNFEHSRKCKGIGYGMRGSGGQFDSLLHVNYFIARRDHAGCGCYTNNRLHVCGRTDGPMEKCFNDSGGPLICDGQAVGLANIVLECDNTARPNSSCGNQPYYRYIYLCAYFDWIALFVDQFKKRCKPHKPLLVLLSSAVCLHPTTYYFGILFAIITFIHCNL